jgi:hypothetical protein
MELGLQEVTYAVMVARSTSPGYTVALIDVAIGSKPKAELVSLEFVADRKSDVQQAIKDAFTDNDRAPNKLVFMHQETKKGRNPSGTWTMIHSEHLDPIIFQDRLVVTSYGKNR